MIDAPVQRYAKIISGEETLYIDMSKIFSVIIGVSRVDFKTNANGDTHFLYGSNADQFVHYWDKWHDFVVKTDNWK